MDHYLCHKCYIPRTKGLRDCDTVDFFPKHTTLKPLTMQEQIMENLQELVLLFKQHSPKASTGSNTSIHTTPIIPTVKNTFITHKYNTHLRKKKNTLLPRVKEHCTLPRVHNEFSTINTPTILTIPNKFQHSNNLNDGSTTVEQ